MLARRLPQGAGVQVKARPGARRRGPVLLRPARRQWRSRWRTWCSSRSMACARPPGGDGTGRRDQSRALQGPAPGARLGRGRARRARCRVAECVGGGSARARADAGLEVLPAVDGQSPVTGQRCSAHAEQASRRVRQSRWVAHTHPRELTAITRPPRRTRGPCGVGAQCAALYAS